MTELLTIKTPEFSCTATREGARIHAVLEGNADIVAIDGLSRLLTKVHAEATVLPPEEVVVDVRQLEFMNSSCFKTFVIWISDIQALIPARQYHVRFVSNPSIHWQKRSLHALRCFAIELITLDGQPGSP
jgi:hypothetical protein